MCIVMILIALHVIVNSLKKYEKKIPTVMDQHAYIGDLLLMLKIIMPHFTVSILHPQIKTD